MFYVLIKITSPILHNFLDIEDFWSKFCCQQTGCLSLTYLFGVDT